MTKSKTNIHGKKKKVLKKKVRGLLAAFFLLQDSLRRHEKKFSSNAHFLFVITSVPSLRPAVRSFKFSSQQTVTTPQSSKSFHCQVWKMTMYVYLVAVTARNGEHGDEGFYSPPAIRGVPAMTKKKKKNSINIGYVKTKADIDARMANGTWQRTDLIRSWVKRFIWERSSILWQRLGTLLVATENAKIHVLWWNRRTTPNRQIFICWRDTSTTLGSPMKGIVP